MLCVLAASTASRAADLVKADNTTDLGTAGAYTDPVAVPAAADTIVFSSTLATASSFSWATSRAVQTLRLTNPANAVTITLGNGTTELNASASTGTVIDMSTATKNLTLTAAAAGRLVRVRGTGGAAGVATIAVATGQTLRIQTGLTYNNTAAGTGTIRVTGAGNVTVDGTYGSISDKAGTSIAALSQEGTGTVTLSGANTYTGGTSITSGTLFAGAGKALGDGAVTVGGGTLDLNGSNVVNLTLASNKNFTFSNGTLKLDLGAGFDQITGGGTGKFTLTGGTFALTLGTGFDYGIIYQVFSGFDAATSTAAGLTFTGFDTAAYQASLNNLGQLSFSPTAVPEPSTYAAIAGGLSLAGVVLGRRRFAKRD